MADFLEPVSRIPPGIRPFGGSLPLVHPFEPIFNCAVKPQPLASRAAFGVQLRITSQLKLVCVSKLLLVHALDMFWDGKMLQSFRLGLTYFLLLALITGLLNN